ncbi:cytochrome P450 [Gigaspora margarita]|uniref:Cytochrome P450 n=1 Tax=Gigaspora margarita TaxID=4874 RepID=A0A8H4AMK0_GIGMA|nr:cytochrome P450 [Gigaspora margarita]
MFVIISSLVILLLLTIFYKKCTLHYSSSQIFLITNIDEARKILNDSDILSRAIPNQGLKKAFQISNPFTNPNENYRKEFVKVIHKTINFDNNKWQRFANIALETVKNEKVFKTGFIELVPWVQKITLSIILRGYLGFAANVYEVIDDIPKLINDIWLKSKQYDKNQKSIQQSISLLKNKLYRAALMSQSKDEGINVIQEISKIAHKHLNDIQELPQLTSGFINPTEDELETPLNIIIPAYETMWRVLLYAILEIKVREFLIVKNNSKMKKNNHLKDLNNSIDNFLKNPTYSTLKTNSLNLIVKETLRLYPATRRIHRTCNGRKYMIDVEKIHRDPTTWGDDSLCFKPERFEKSDTSSWYIPFSVGKMKCAASEKFAPTVAAILIAAVLSSVDIVDVVDNEAINKYRKNPDLPFENHRLAFDKMIVNLTTLSK